MIAASWAATIAPTIASPSRRTVNAAALASPTTTNGTTRPWASASAPDSATRSRHTRATPTAARNGHSDWISSVQLSSSGVIVTAADPDQRRRETDTPAGERVPAAREQAGAQHRHDRQLVEVDADHGDERGEDQRKAPRVQRRAELRTVADVDGELVLRSARDWGGRRAAPSPDGCRAPSRRPTSDRRDGSST